MNEDKIHNLITQGDYFLRKLDEKMAKARTLQHEYVKNSRKFPLQLSENTKLKLTSLPQERLELEWDMEAYYLHFLVNLNCLQKYPSYGGKSFNLAPRKIFDKRIEKEVESIDQILIHHRDALCHIENDQLKRSDPKYRYSYDDIDSSTGDGSLCEQDRKDWDEKMDKIEIVIFAKGYSKQSITVGGSTVNFDDIKKYWEKLKEIKP